MRKYSCIVLAALVLGLQSVPSMALSICNGGTDCPDVLITPISATGQSNDLSDPDNLKILVGNSFLVEINVDGRTFPIVDVVAADYQVDVVTNSGVFKGLRCTDFFLDLTRKDQLLETCSQCAAACGPPNAAGAIDFGGFHTVDYFAYAAEMTLTCLDSGSYTIQFGGGIGNTAIGTLSGAAINIIDDPTHWESIKVVCRYPQGQCCRGNDCLDSSCATAGASMTTTSEDECIACGGSWTFGDDCRDACLCDTDEDCNDGDGCTDNVCDRVNGQCSSSLTATAAACDAQNDPPCAEFECNTATGACDDLSSGHDGVACTDDDSCTDGDECLAGVCDPGELILGRTCAGDSDCDNLDEGISADPGSCLATVCACPKSTPTPTVIGGIGSRYVRIDPDLSSIDAVALRVECNGVIEWVEMTPALTDFDDGPQGLVNVGIGRSTCDNSYFVTPAAWTSGGNNPLYVTGLSVAPGSRPTVYAVSGDCTTPLDSDPSQPISATWVFGDSDGDGQVTFVADLFKQFSNHQANGSPYFTGPDPGVEVDTQGDSPSVPDQQILFFTDMYKALTATMAGGGATWTGQACP